MRFRSMPTGSGPITIERQGSFFVDGREVVAGGKYDGTASVFPPGAGQKYWIDQMYIQYQVPVNARTLPMVLVLGGGGDAFECRRMGLAVGRPLVQGQGHRQLRAVVCISAR